MDLGWFRGENPTSNASDQPFNSILSYISSPASTSVVLASSWTAGHHKLVIRSNDISCWCWLMVIDVFSSEVEILRIRMKGYVNHGWSGWLRLTRFLRQNSWDPEPGVLIFRWTRPVQWYLTHHWYVWCQKLKTMQLQTLGTFLGVPKHFGNPKVLWFENACWWMFQRENCHFGVWELPKRSTRIQRDLPKLIKLRTYLSYFRIGFQIWFFTSSLGGAVPKNPTVPNISSASRSNGHGMLNAWPSDPILIEKKLTQKRRKWSETR